MHNGTIISVSDLQKGRYRRFSDLKKYELAQFSFLDFTAKKIIYCRNGFRTEKREYLNNYESDMPCYK